MCNCFTAYYHVNRYPSSSFLQSKDRYDTSINYINTSNCCWSWTHSQKPISLQGIWQLMIRIAWIIDFASIMKFDVWSNHSINVFMYIVFINRLNHAIHIFQNQEMILIGNFLNVRVLKCIKTIQNLYCLLYFFMLQRSWKCLWYEC